MVRHPRYSDIPFRHRWWLMFLVVIVALFLIGVGVTSGLL